MRSTRDPEAGGTARVKGRGEGWRAMPHSSKQALRRLLKSASVGASSAGFSERRVEDAQAPRCVLQIYF